MATHTITAVHLEPAYAPSTHEHIARVRIAGHTSDYSRAQVIAAIRGGDRFFTNAVPPALVYVHRCPHCAASDYITMHPDATATNNLLHLPRY